MPATEHRISLPNRYRVLRHVASGGMASVWAAQDELLDRLVAVKVLAPAYAEDERAVRRFQREARAGARLSDHPHVVTVYDIGEHDGRAFMVMEYLPGGTVSDRLKRGQPIPRPLALRWLRETAEALDAAQALDIVHRDVKPANLLLDERGRLAVGDFGIATVASEASVTQTGQVLGTAAYLSPEQALGRPATAASDRYALTVVAYELLTGRRPFTADHPTAQARAHVEASVPPASEQAPLPPAIDRVLQWGMAKDPADRPPAAGAFVEALEGALGAQAEPVAEPTAATRRLAAAAAGAPAPRRRPRQPTSPSSRVPPSGPRPAPVASAPDRRGWPALVALALIALVAGAIVAIAAGVGGGSGRTGTTARHAATTQQPASTTHKHKAAPARAQTQTPTQQTQPAPQPAGEDPKALNDEGYALTNRGAVAQALAPLQRSVTLFRQQQRTGEIDYAYALYNLAHALRVTGHPADAIPYLQERLQLTDFKKGVVQRELDLAGKEAGVSGGDTKKHGKGKGGKD